jgi:predicted neutral ceramidase superfamily lipid hydrolase
LKNNSENSISLDSEQNSGRARKFKQAGYGFLIMNLIYLVIVVQFIPALNFDMSALLSFLAYVLFMGLLTYYLLQQKKLLTQILAVIYAGRSGNAIYFLLGDNIFPAVPYFLPCLLITFYLLGRAGWDWP